jgi:CxxC motif-containing protein (DUF1111 family)
VGAPNVRYPDLYAFKGTGAEFRARVRVGGGGMAAYPPAVIADADVDAAYAFFAGGKRAGLDSVALGGVEPLFAAPAPGAAAGNPPIVFRRDDGVLVTRGAGRVRARHEGPQDTNVTFMEFVADYFLSRSYGFLIEDFTPLGESRVRVTYLPLAMPTDATNFRAWKVYSSGDVFALNGMLRSDVALPSLATGAADLALSYQQSLAPYARVQQGETVRNEREHRPIQAGDLLDFEFGIFVDAGGVRPPGSRTAYYSDTFRYRVGKGGLTASSADPYGGAGRLGPAEGAQQGGDTTNVWPYHMQETSYGQMALNIQHENVQRFLEGRRLFHTSFATGEHTEMGNPPFPEQAGKAGPQRASSCETCHARNGAGALLEGAFDERSSMVFKLHDAGGAIRGQLHPPEGSATVSGFDEKTVALAGGPAVTLRRPRIAVTTGGGAARFSARIARRLVGAGLLEAIDERTILARADGGDCDGNGISGRPSYVEDPVSGVLRLGRFGWKAEKTSVGHQVADALFADMGVGTSLFPERGTVELADEDLARLVTYMRLLAVPAQRDRGDARVARGEELFATVGCASCHVTDVVTGAHHPFAELRNQAIKPYSDLLLHDLGPGLADDSGVPLPDSDTAPTAASEWRTPPLWGIGLQATVNGHAGLLHDGRASTVLEAILWHGGEAASVAERVASLPAADREALLAFVQSL